MAQTWRDVDEAVKSTSRPTHGWPEDRKEAWRDATPDEERAIRLECIRLVMSQPKTPINPLKLAGELADFILGSCRN